MADKNEAIDDLEKFYTNVVKDWGNSECRNIGHLLCSPSISFNTGDEGFTKDWGTFELDEDRWKAQFRGNVLDLGAFRFMFLIFASSDEFNFIQEPQFLSANSLL